MYNANDTRLSHVAAARAAITPRGVGRGIGRVHASLVGASAPGFGTVFLLSQIDDVFISGFVAGMRSSVPNPLWTQLASRVDTDPIGFINGYNLGCVRGLGAGLRNLVTGLIDIFRLASEFSPPARTIAMVAEGFMLLTDAAHRELRSRQIAQGRAIASAVNATLRDVLVRPADYVALSGDAGQLLGAHVGSIMTADLSARTARQLGDLVGQIAGQVGFEVILQALLALATEGVGNTVRAGTAAAEAARGIEAASEAARASLALGEATRGGGQLAQLASRLRMIMARLPGVQRLFAALGRERQAQALLRVDAEVSRAVEAAFAEGAQFEAGVLRVIRVGDPGVTLTAEQLARWRSLRGATGLPEDFARLWSACGNEAAHESLAEIRRLWALGDDASKLEARRLARITFNNWRNRFMRQLRQPGNAALRARVESAGFRFGGGATSSPRLAAGSQEALTLDHVRRLMENPARCVDPANLEFVIGFENSVTLEQLRNLTSVDMF